ncbi:MAG: cation:proton antiporter [Candidatus Micrarchaeia archaeon]
MIGVGILFIAIAAIAFLGFIINALFDKLRITDVLPLMLIGLVIGPVLGLVNVGSQSIIAELTPYVTAIAISFVLFDIGINIHIDEIKDIFAKITAFTLLTQVLAGIVLAGLAFYFMKWTIIESFIFGFAVSGPSTIIVPVLARSIKVPKPLKVTLVYESVVTDIAELIVPIVLLDFMVNVNAVTATYIGSFVFTIIFGSLLLGVAFALFWLYIMNRFKEYSKGYTWILTLTMIIATYGIAQFLGLNGAITIFIFGFSFYNIGIHKKTSQRSKSIIGRYFSISEEVKHVRQFQKEVVFFVSTFFFVYIGLLFSVQQASYALIGIALLMSLIIIPLRFVFLPIIKGVLSRDKQKMKIEKYLVGFDVARGLSPAIVATLPLSMGINIPNFVDIVFIVILVTNVISSIGIFASYKRYEK